MMKKLLCCVLGFMAVFVPAAATHYWLSEPTISVPDAANGGSGGLFVSGNGRYVSFASGASNWLPDDVNGAPDYFFHDLQTGQTALLLTDELGQQIAEDSFYFSSQVSDDGQKWLFMSFSTQWPDADGGLRIYSKNLVTQAITNESEYGGGNYFDAPFIFMSGDGSAMVFDSETMIDPLHTVATGQVYRKDLSTGTYELLSVSSDGMVMADADVDLVGFSPNGRYVLMRTDANNLVGPVPGLQLILKDLDLGTYELITQQPNGDPSATIAGFGSTYGYVNDNGQVLFLSTASDLVVADTNLNRDLFFYSNDLVQRISLNSNGNQVADPGIGQFALSPDGARAVFVADGEALIPGLDIGDDSNEYDPLYAFDINTSELSVINAVNNQVFPSRVAEMKMGPQGQLWLFTNSTNLPGIQTLTLGEFNFLLYEYDWNAGTFARTIEVAQPTSTIIDNMNHGIASSDQRWVLSATRSSNLAADHGEDQRMTLLLMDRYTNQWEVIGRGVTGISSFGPSYDLSASGQYVVFESAYFHPGGMIELGARQLFLYDRDADAYTQITQGNDPKVSDDGVVVFTAFDPLVSQDLNGTSDVYWFDHNTSSLGLVSANPSTLESGNDFSADPDIGGSGLGTRITFSSRATDLTGESDTNNREDVFITPLNSDVIIRASEDDSGVGGNGSSEYPRISNQGNVVVYRTRAENLTNDDYTNADVRQYLHYEVGTGTNRLASKNSAGFPIEGRIPSTQQATVSESGRFVTFAYEDEGSDDDYNGDDDDQPDVVLVDMLTGNIGVISDVFFTGYNTDEALNPFVAEDVSHTPSLVGVVYNSKRLLSTALDSPNNFELYMHQQGGGDIMLSLEIDGQGTVSGSLGVNCQSQCDYDFPIESSVSLVAIPDSGHEFYGWQDVLNSCDAENPACTVDIDDRPRALKAIFLSENDLIFRSAFE